MKTDKELLELAAKAAGIVRGYHKFASNGKPELYDIIDKGRDSTAWNPLTDDGDALRLAVKLDMLINPDNGTINTCTATGGFADVFENSGDNPYAATRRAIVRAAAAIGEKL